MHRQLTDQAPEAEGGSSAIDATATVHVEHEWPQTTADDTNGFKSDTMLAA